ncbi:putative Negative regulator of flagellin synthesis [Burkholderiales bacterium]|nr:putative Negative regulator of flagellin synthesis [Burkholderiales bacterium]
MKITNSSSAPKPAPLTGATRAGATGRQSSSQGAGATSVSTDPSSRLGQLEAQLSPSDFSAAKVSEITSAIAAGRYQVNAGAVADKLLASTAALAGKSGGAA